MSRMNDDPTKLCACGCGGTPRQAQSVFCHGHNRRQYVPDYQIVDTGYQTPCWLWLRPLHRKGYARQVMIAGQRMKPHTRAYVNRYGPVPDGLVIDHLCRKRHCVNPDHLEAVTNHENVLRGIAARRLLKTEAHP